MERAVFIQIFNTTLLEPKIDLKSLYDEEGKQEFLNIHPNQLVDKLFKQIPIHDTSIQKFIDQLAKPFLKCVNLCMRNIIPHTNKYPHMYLTDFGVVDDSYKFNDLGLVEYLFRRYICKDISLAHIPFSTQQQVQIFSYLVDIKLLFDISAVLGINYDKATLESLFYISLPGNIFNLPYFTFIGLSLVGTGTFSRILNVLDTFSRNLTYSLTLYATTTLDVSFDVSSFMQNIMCFKDDVFAHAHLCRYINHLSKDTELSSTGSEDPKKINKQ